MSEAQRAAIARIACAVALWCAAPASAQITSPAAAFGFEPGADRKLADYDQVSAWFTALAAASDRVEFSSLGKTTEGRELGFAIISSAKNIASVEAIRASNLALADPRTLKPGDAARLAAAGKTIVCLNASIHSTEVGPTQATVPLAYLLATTEDPELLKVLDDVVLLMIPCHNPDGYSKQVAWYRRTVGTPHEGCPLPGLYHPYAGHDNNRDWFMFNLAETRLTVEQVYRRWLPQIVIDMHQMQEDGPRMFTPPYQDPVEPNVPAILVEQLNELGASVQRELAGKGLEGIVNRRLFDAWSPSRAYMHYHGGVRFLVEIASCRLATPIEKKGRPRWALADIVRYGQETTLAVLRHASRNRARWLESFHENFRGTCASTEGPAAFVIPVHPSRFEARAKLLSVLQMGGLEASHHPDMTVVIERGQPFFPFARALLENTPYPVIRATESSPIRKPYDVTAHSLPLLMNVAVEQRDPPKQHFRPGWPRDFGKPLRPLMGGADARIGLYDSAVPNVMDAGWTRLWLTSSELRHRLIDDRALATLDPAALDVLILPSLTADLIQNGNRGAEFPPEFRGGIGDAGAAAIDTFVRSGGTLVALRQASAFPMQLFKLPIRNVLTRIPEGRRLVIPGAILRVDLDTTHAIAASQPSSVSALFESGKAFEADASAELDQSIKPVIIGRWAPAAELVLGGYSEGHDLIAGKAAIVEAQVGKGRVILFGFSPQFRCQTWATFGLLENALRTTRGVR